MPIPFFNRTNKDIGSSNMKLELENTSLKQQNSELKKELNSLKQELSDRSTIGLAGFEKDSEPSDEQSRKSYVAEVHNFFEAILQPKLRVTIADVRDQISSVSYSGVPSYVPREHYDWYLRGTENACWLIYEWGNRCSGEHQSNQSDYKEDN